MVDNTEKKYSLNDLLAENRKLQKQVKELKKKKFNYTVESTYKDFFDNAPLPYQSLEESGEIIAVNSHWLTFFGYQYDEVIGKNFGDFMSPADKSSFPERYANLLKEGIIHNIEFELVKKSGELVPISLNGIIQNDKNAQFKAMHCILNDISWQKETEDEIRVFMESVENSSDAIGMSTPKGKHFYQNKAFDQMFGYVGENPPATIYVNKEVGNEVFETIMAGEKWDGEVEMYHRNGEILNILLRAYASKDNKGSIRVLVGVHTDITKRKQTEIALKKSKEEYKEASIFLETLFNVIPDVLGVQDNNHNIIRYNKAGYKFLNKTYEDVKGKKCYEFLGRSIDCETCATAETYKTKKPAHVEKYIPQMDIYLDVYSYPILDKNGNIKLVIEHLRNNTARKKAEKELIIAKEHAEESDRLKSAFLANLSHEIRTPMNGILGFTELLQNTEISAQKKDSYIDIIKKSGTHLLLIINDIVEISRIETGQIKPIYSCVNINSLFQDLYKIIKISIPKEKKLELKIDEGIPEEDIVIKTDEVKLRQILSNLLTNAIKYTDQGTVSFGFNINRTINFFVKDTGAGIDKKYHQLIFERFRRVDEENTSSKRGSGLGLAISKAYVEMLGGTIHVESEFGKGSIFSFTLPYSICEKEKKPLTGRKKSKLVKADNKITILVAEDDEFNFIYFSELFSNSEYELIRAFNGKEAIDICSSNNDIQLVLMDIKMPEMDGFKAYKEIKKIRPHLPVIAQTAYALSDDAKNIQNAGFSGYIAKPIDKEELFDLISDTLNLQCKK